MLLSILCLVAGFILLIKGADFLVEGASSLAVKMSISEIVVGLTVVAFGTSAPELIVNVIASLQNNSAITFGNIVGSNIANILLILGVAGIIAPIATEKNTVWKEIPFAFLAAIILLVACNDVLLLGLQSNVISFGDGVVLLLFFIAFLVYTFAIPKIQVDDVVEITKISNVKIGVYIFIGLIMLVAGGKFVVDNAVFIAKNLGISDKTIGLTVVAIGTSLPELFTSAIAVYKKKNDIAVGNVVGSNIFNIFFILGTSTIISPVALPSGFNIDLLVLVAASAFLFFTMFTGKKRTLDRWEAILFVLGYIAYTIFLIFKQ